MPRRFHPLAPGETVCIAVHRRSGEVSTETVRCFWRGVSARTDEVVALCEIVPSDAGALARVSGVEVISFLAIGQIAENRV